MNTVRMDSKTSCASNKVKHFTILCNLHLLEVIQSKKSSKWKDGSVTRAKKIEHKRFWTRIQISLWVSPTKVRKLQHDLWGALFEKWLKQTMPCKCWAWTSPPNAGICFQIKTSAYSCAVWHLAKKKNFSVSVDLTDEWTMDCSWPAEKSKPELCPQESVLAVFPQRFTGQMKLAIGHDARRKHKLTLVPCVAFCRRIVQQQWRWIGMERPLMKILENYPWIFASNPESFEWHHSRISWNQTLVKMLAHKSRRHWQSILPGTNTQCSSTTSSRALSLIAHARFMLDVCEEDVKPSVFWTRRAEISSHCLVGQMDINIRKVRKKWMKSRVVGMESCSSEYSHPEGE